MTRRTPLRPPPGFDIVYQTRWWTMRDNGSYVTVHRTDHFQGAGALMIDAERRVLLLENFRNSVDRIVREIPRGGVDQGESSFEAARREAEEETGVTLPPNRCIDLGFFYPDTGILTMELRLIAAILENPFPRIVIDPGESMSHALVSWEEFSRMCRHGEILDAATLIAWGRLLGRIEAGEIALP